MFPKRERIIQEWRNYENKDWQITYQSKIKIELYVYVYLHKYLSYKFEHSTGSMKCCINTNFILIVQILS